MTYTPEQWKGFAEQAIEDAEKKPTLHSLAQANIMLEGLKQRGIEHNDLRERYLKVRKILEEQGLLLIKQE